MFCLIRNIIVDVMWFCYVSRLILNVAAFDDFLMVKGWPCLSLSLRLGRPRLGKHVTRCETLRELLIGTVESCGLIVL